MEVNIFYLFLFINRLSWQKEKQMHWQLGLQLWVLMICKYWLRVLLILILHFVLELKLIKELVLKIVIILMMVCGRWSLLNNYLLIVWVLKIKIIITNFYCFHMIICKSNSAFLCIRFSGYKFEREKNNGSCVTLKSERDGANSSQ